MQEDASLITIRGEDEIPPPGDLQLLTGNTQVQPSAPITPFSRDDQQGDEEEGFSSPFSTDMKPAVPCTRATDCIKKKNNWYIILQATLTNTDVLAFCAAGFM